MTLCDSSRGQNIELVREQVPHSDMAFCLALRKIQRLEIYRDDHAALMVSSLLSSKSNCGRLLDKMGTPG